MYIRLREYTTTNSILPSCAASCSTGMRAKFGPFLIFDRNNRSQLQSAKDTISFDSPGRRLPRSFADTGHSADGHSVVCCKTRSHARLDRGFLRRELSEAVRGTLSWTNRSSNTRSSGALPSPGSTSIVLPAIPLPHEIVRRLNSNCVPVLVDRPRRGNWADNDGPDVDVASSGIEFAGGSEHTGSPTTTQVTAR